MQSHMIVTIPPIYAHLKCGMFNKQPSTMECTALAFTYVFLPKQDFQAKKWSIKYAQNVINIWPHYSKAYSMNTGDWEPSITDYVCTDSIYWANPLNSKHYNHQKQDYCLYV